MINLGNNIGYKKEYFTVPASTVYTVEFGSYPAPNYFRVNNMGDTSIYCSTMSMPSDRKYDFKVEPKSTTNFAEPYNRERLYIFNPTAKEIPISVTSWYGEFDPSFLAVSEITFNADTTIKTDGLINGFTCSLPTGSNKIGEVSLNKDIETNINKLTDLQKTQIQIRDNIGTQYGTKGTLIHNLWDIKEILIALKNDGGGGETDLTEVLNYLEGISGDINANRNNTYELNKITPILEKLINILDQYDYYTESGSIINIIYGLQSYLSDLSTQTQLIINKDKYVYSTQNFDMDEISDNVINSDFSKFSLHNKRTNNVIKQIMITASDYTMYNETIISDKIYCYIYDTDGNTIFADYLKTGTNYVNIYIEKFNSNTKILLNGENFSNIDCDLKVTIACEGSI